MLLIKNGNILTMDKANYPLGFIITEGKKIKAVGDMSELKVNETDFDRVIDAKKNYVCPGFIDSHCHIGMWEDSMDFEGADGNEDTDPITPHLRAIDAINPFDRSFKDAYLNGITTVVTGPGSANPIGGQFAALKTFGTSVDDMLLKAPVAIKFALGENPKTTYHSKNRAPVTRMGTAALIREALTKALLYKKQLHNHKLNKGEKTEFDFKSEALQQVLQRKIPAKFHAHRADDIATAIRIGKEFNIDVTIEHGTEANLILETIADNDIALMLGPGLCDRGKIELKNLGFDNYNEISKSGASVAIITDHPVVPIEYLPLMAALAVKKGLSKDEALRAITINAAKNCRLEKQIGSLSPGKDADIVITDKYPIDFYAKIIFTIVNGEIVCE